MNREEVINLAEEALSIRMEDKVWTMSTTHLEHFANAIANNQRAKLAFWMMSQGYSTGHGDTIEDLLNELDWQIAENWTRGMVNGVHAEREACAKLVEILIPEQTEEGLIGHTIAKAIRARGEQ